MRTVDFYFDFISPYSYLAATQIPALMERNHARAQFHLHAIDMWAARIAAGNTGPSNRQIPRKAACLMADVARWSKRYKVPLGMPKSFDMHRLNRAFWFADSRQRGTAFMTNTYRLVWGEGGDPASADLLKSAAAAAGLDGAELLAQADSPEFVALYERETTEAEERGVFGSPFFIVGKEVFWGNDRISFVEAELDQ